MNELTDPIPARWTLPVRTTEHQSTAPSEPPSFIDRILTMAWSALPIDFLSLKGAGEHIHNIAGSREWRHIDTGSKDIPFSRDPRIEKDKVDNCPLYSVSGSDANEERLNG